MKSIVLGMLLAAGMPAFAATTYLLTFTNGSKTPLSPSAIYVTEGQTGRAQLGQAPSPAFVQLCQMGNAAARANELRADSRVKFVTSTMGMLMPGQSQTVEVEVADPAQQSIQFESMYGKTKDVCATAGFNSHSLQALRQHVTTSAVLKDNAVQTGAFADPAIPAGGSYLDTNICNGLADATACLRSLSLPTQGTIRSFTPYLPTVLMLLEAKYGANDLQTLIIPDAGAVQLELKLKH